MLDLNVQWQNIKVVNIQKNDVDDIKKWLYKQSEFAEESVYPIEVSELYDRFLEYYISENEFFSKIQFENKTIGILKGRVEFKNPSEAWIWCLMIDYEYRGKGIGSRVIDEVNSYLNREYNIEYFYTTVMRDSFRTIEFLKKNGYKIKRVSKNYYDINGKQMDMLILKK
ncbi:GNAT family N-acetyltransferase [Clostridium malenominatum]|uniref:GNAT family N-acetyltransferase n=1 Tax=Clostridium malenominatum TaxID=1539 RepID=A0ABN1IP88_9CLOT